MANNFKTLKVSGANISTGDFSNDNSKYKRQIERKTVYLTFLKNEQKEQIDLLTDFGMTAYDPKDQEKGKEVVYFIAPFSKTVTFYYDEQKAKYSGVEMTKDKPNIQSSNVEVALTSNVSPEGQTFFRVSALKFESVEKVEQYSVEHFDDTEDYTEIDDFDFNKLPKVENNQIEE